MQIEDIYITLTIVLAAIMLIFGLQFGILSRKTESPVLRQSARILIFTYCYFGLVNVMEAWGFTTEPTYYDIMLFRVATLITAVSQCFTLTFALVLLINASYVTRKRIFHELIPIATLSAVLLTLFFIAPPPVLEISIYIFIIFYIYLLIKYTWIFVITYRNALRKLDNFFSGQEALRLRWINVSFFAALSIGVIALLGSLFPSVITGIICYIFYYVFYISFAINFVNHGFVYKKLEQVLTEEKDDDDDETEYQKSEEEDEYEEEDEEKNLMTLTTQNLIWEKLKTWQSEKHFLNPDITIDDVSQKIGTNKKYISIYVNRHINKSFRNWINDLRIEEAKNLLLEQPEMSIKQISEKTGFSKSSYFSKLFFLNTKRNPLAWRKEQL